MGQAVRMADQPPRPECSSLVDGVDAVAAACLGMTSLRHRGALQRLPAVIADDVVAAIVDRVRDNWQASSAASRMGKSAQNWRWRAPQFCVSPANRSPEVTLERAIVASAERVGRTDWANQVPVASGLVTGARDRRRAIDLVQQRGAAHFHFIELKIASDTPLYAAVEIIGYVAIWLMSRLAAPAPRSALLDATRLDLRVLAPASYYRSYRLTSIERALDGQLAHTGKRHGVDLSFAFDVLPDGVSATLADADLLSLLDRRRCLHRESDG